MDVHSKKQRSFNMSQIKGKNTKPEVLVRKHLFSKGFRYRINDKRYPGKPDIVLPKYKIILFIHGCFWHQHDCKYFKWPKTNLAFWKNKIEGNIIRDRNNISELEKMGWKIIIIWECEISSKQKLESKMNKVIKQFKKRLNKCT